MEKAARSLALATASLAKIEEMISHLLGISNKEIISLKELGIPQLLRQCIKKIRDSSLTPEADMDILEEESNKGLDPTGDVEGLKIMGLFSSRSPVQEEDHTSSCSHYLNEGL